MLGLGVQAQTERSVFSLDQFWNLQSSETIQKKFKSRFGNKCKTHIQLVNTIPSEASGKTRQVISKVQAPSF